MKQRIITGVLAGAVYLLFLFLGSVSFALFAAVLAIISFTELAAMKKLKRTSFAVIAGAIITGLIVLENLATLLFSASFGTVLIKLITLLLLFLLVATVFTKNKFQYEQAAYVLFSVIYIGFSFYLLVHLRMQSLQFVLFVQILIWATDSGAYFIGKQWGRHKLAPHISPNKTIEGSAGALLSAVLVAIIFQLIVQAPLFSSWGALLAISILISVAGQLGDLAESAVKRYFMVKDSGAILPGHGGLFDRFDSLIFVLPVLFLLGVIN
ncbi:MAG: phosphatidate cytidylyltransferase [Sporolactobacillus sp.]